MNKIVEDFKKKQEGKFQVKQKVSESKITFQDGKQKIMQTIVLRIKKSFTKKPKQFAKETIKGEAKGFQHQNQSKPS